MKTASIALILAAALAAPAASAESRIVPAAPSSFELVNLRMNVDSCAFNPGVVRVSMSGNHIVVAARRNQCLVAGSPLIVDIQLGALPAGSYTVSVHDNPSDFAPPYESARFEVTERPEIAVFPPPVRPLTNYTGMWSSPQEPGWGLALNQGVSNALFGAWFVYGTNGEPQWFTLQGGQWTSSTRWTGPVYRTTGPSFAAPEFDARLVHAEPVGSATLNFTQTSAEVEGLARFSYTVDGTASAKTLARIAF